MARSESADITINRDTIIKHAMLALGALTRGQDPTTNELADYGQRLTDLIKSWMGGPKPIMPGMKVWLRTRKTISLDNTKNTYSLQASDGDVAMDPPIKIEAAYLRDSDGNDIPLRIMRTVQEYESISDKDKSGTPTAIFYERSYGTGELYLDTTPNDTTTYPSLILVYQRPVYDFDEAADDADFPAEYHLALVYNLAEAIAPDIVGDVPAHISGLAQKYLTMASLTQLEVSDIYFEPDKE